MDADPTMVHMTNSTSTPAGVTIPTGTTLTSTTRTSSSATRRRNGLRRGVAGLVAAATIAFGGTSLLSATDAQAAGVHAANYTNTYAVQSDSVQVRHGSTRGLA